MDDKFIAYQKLPKKKQRELDRARRGSWGEVNPVTRRAERSSAYDRKAEKRRWRSETRGGDGMPAAFLFC